MIAAPQMTSRGAVSRRPGPLVVAGNLSLDDTFNATGSLPDSPGGDALYASIGARLWGEEVRILVLVGEDYPEAYLDRISAIGIDTGLVRRVPGPTVHYRVVDDPGGNRTYIHLTDEARLAETSPQEEDYRDMAGWGWLHLAAMPIEAHVIGVRAARLAGVPVTLDPHEEYVLGHEGTLRDLVAGVGFMPSELEASLLFPDLAAIGSGITLGAAAAERLASWGATFAALKLGASGSIVRDAGRTYHVGSVDVQVVDLIGAGDAYCGGFVAGFRRTGSLQVAAACGSVSAGHAIAQFGAFPQDPLPEPGAVLSEAIALLRACGAPDSVITVLEPAILAG